MAVLSWRLAALALVLAVAPSSSVDVMSRGRKVDGPKSERISGPKSDRPQKMGAQAEADAEVGGKIGAQAEADAEVDPEVEISAPAEGGLGDSESEARSLGFGGSPGDAGGPDQKEDDQDPDRKMDGPEQDGGSTSGGENDGAEQEQGTNTNSNKVDTKTSTTGENEKNDGTIPNTRTRTTGGAEAETGTTTSAPAGEEPKNNLAEAEVFGLEQLQAQIVREQKASAHARLLRQRLSLGLLTLLIANLLIGGVIWYFRSSLEDWFGRRVGK